MDCLLAAFSTADKLVVSFDKDFEKLKEEDPFFADDAVYHGEVPSDLSEKHDDYSVD